MRKHQGFAAPVVGDKGHKLVFHVAQQRHQMGQAANRRAVDRLDDGRRCIGIAPGKFVREEGRRDHHQLFTFRRGRVAPRRDQRAAHKAKRCHGTRVVVHEGCELDRGFGKHHRAVDEIRRVVALQVRDQQRPVGQQGQRELKRLPRAHDGDGHARAFGQFLHGIAHVQAQVRPGFDHALVVHRRVADVGDDIPFLERVVGVRAKRLVHHNTPDAAVQLEKGAQCRVLQRLHLVVYRRLAVVAAIGHVGQEQLDLFIGDDVANVLRVAEAAVGQADHLVTRNGRPAAVAGVDGSVNLDAQARDGEVVPGVLYARNNAFGDGHGRAARGEAVGQHGIFHLGQRACARQWRMQLEERLVIQLEHRQVDARRNGNHRCRELVPRAIGLHLHQ